MSYSIYYMERPIYQVWFGESCLNNHHAFLALVKEGVDHPPVIEQEIHFKNEGFLKLKIHDYPYGNMKGDHFNEVSPYGHIGGDETYIRSLWKEARGIAEVIQAGKLPFGVCSTTHSFNCRSASIALLHTLGLSYYSPEGVDTDVGIHANILARIGSDKKVEKNKLPTLEAVS